MSVGKFFKQIYFFIGTTAELIKVSPVINDLEKRKVRFKIITSGQTDVNFEELSFFIKKGHPDISFGEKSQKSSTLLFLVWFIRALTSIPTLKKEFNGLDKNNSYFIVHGDPVSSLVGAIIAKFYNLKLVHIESGLRSFNFLEPFPEEICRLIISRFADIKFCPNEWSMNNLLKERNQKVNTFQNTQIECFMAAAKERSSFEDDLELKDKKYFVLVMHRQEHVVFGKEKTKKLLKYIIRNADRKLLCVFIRHSTTLNFLNSVNFRLSPGEAKRIKFVSRLRYVDFVNLINKSEFLVTDGGSNQEEAYYMGLPCLLLRNYTERIEGLGENAVLSRNNKKIIRTFLKNYKSYRMKKVRFKVRPSKIIVDYLLKN